MSCPYFKLGECLASLSSHIPDMKKMETYCSSERYRLCPDFAEWFFHREAVHSLPRKDAAKESNFSGGKGPANTRNL